MIKKTFLMILLAGTMLAAPLRPALAISPDYAQDVKFNGQASPVDAETGSSVDQFGAGQPNSQIDNYVYQNEQLNLSEDSGVVRVLRTNQKEQVNKFVTAFIPLKSVTVRELRGIARTICRKEGGDADVLNDKVRNKNGIVVVCPPAQLPFLVRTLQTLDEEWVKEVNDGSWYLYYKGKNRDVHNILKTLGFYRTPDAAYEFDDANNAIVIYDQPCIEPLVQHGLKEIDIPPSQILLDVAVYELDTQNDLTLGLDWESWKNGPGRDLFQFVTWDFWGNKLGFPGDAPGNAANWGNFRSYNFLLTSAYIDFLQIKGKARLLTKSTLATKSGTVGEISAVDQVVSFQATSPAPSDLTIPAPFRLSDIYHFYARNGAVSISLEDLSEMSGADQINVISGFLSVTLKASPADSASVIAQLNDKNKDGVITRAELEEVRVPTSLTLQVFRDRTLRYVNSGQAGVLLTVFPVVGLESAEVAMALDVSDVTGFTPSGTPIIEHRYISSQIEMNDGQPFVLGGLTRTTTVKSGGGIPFLRDIPVLGYAFGREVSTKRQKEVLVLVTPRFKLCPMSEPNPPVALEEILKLAKAPLADKEKALAVPMDAFGFDQWLLDPIADARMNATGVIKGAKN